MRIITIMIISAMSIIEAAMMYQLFEIFLSKKAGKVFSVLSFIGLLGISMTPILSGDIDNIIYTFITCLLVGVMFYKEIIIKRICAVFMLFTISVSVKMLSVRLSYLFPIENPDFIGVLGVSLRCFIVVIIYLVLYKAVAWFREISSVKTWILVCTISLATFTSTIVSILPFVFKTSNYYNIIVIAIMTLYIGGMIATFYVIKSIAEGAKSESLNKQLTLQMQHYEELEENQNTTRKLFHDMKNQLGVVSSFLYDNDTEGAQKYLSSITESINSLKLQVFCDNKVADAILNNKYKKLKELNIEAKIDAWIPENISILQTDLCSIFSNTIDNAIEACIKIPALTARYISIKGVVANGYFVYQVENSKINPIRISKNRFISDKKSSVSGYGIDNIRTTVDKYNGNLETEYTDNSFKIIIIIKITSNFSN